MSHEKHGLTPFYNNDFGFFPSNFFSNFMSDRFWDNFGFGNFGGFKVDVREKKDSYIIEAEMPGIDKRNIDIDIDDRMLTISVNINEDKEAKDDEGRYIRRERHVGSFRRSFSLDNVRTEGIRAEMKNGILTIICPKKNEYLPKSRKIDIQ